MHRSYNEWLLGEFPKYSWGAPTCNSYYQTAEGRAPFLFPGNFALYEKLHKEGGLHEYEVS